MESIILRKCKQYWLLRKSECLLNLESVLFKLPYKFNIVDFFYVVNIYSASNVANKSIFLGVCVLANTNVACIAFYFEALECSKLTVFDGENVNLTLVCKEEEFVVDLKNVDFVWGLFCIGWSKLI